MEGQIPGPAQCHPRLGKHVDPDMTQESACCPSDTHPPFPSRALPPSLYLHIVHGQVAAGGPHRPAALEVPLRQLRAHRV